MSKNSNAPSTNYEAENMNMEYTKRIFGKEFGIAYEMPYKRFSIDYGGVKTIRGDGKSRVTTVLPIIKDAFSIDRSLIGFIDIATDTEERGMLFIKAYIDPKLITFANFSSIVPSTGTMRIPIDAIDDDGIYKNNIYKNKIIGIINLAVTNYFSRDCKTVFNTSMPDILANVISIATEFSEAIDRDDLIVSIPDKLDEEKDFAFEYNHQMSYILYSIGFHNEEDRQISNIHININTDRIQVCKDMNDIDDHITVDIMYDGTTVEALYAQVYAYLVYLERKTYELKLHNPKKK